MQFLRTTVHRRIPARLALGSAILLGLSVGAAPSATAQTARYAKAQAGAEARAFEDPRGSLVATLDAGTLLQVHDRSEGTYVYLECEVAGSFPVWVYGKYLTPTGTEGVLEVSGTRVNMRPQPSSSRESMALPTRLDAGTKVEFIRRGDASKAMSEDWVQVWAPPGAKVWVLENQTTRVADAGAAAAEFRSAARTLPTAPRKTPTGSGADTAAAAGAGATAANATRRPATSVPQGARDALARADAQYVELKGRPDNTAAQWQAVRDLYGQAVEQSPEGTTIYALAARGVERTEAHLELLAIRADLDAEAVARREHLQRLVDQEREQRLAQTTTWGRFDSRGWLEKETRAGQPDRWFLRWSGERTTEVVCSQGRYDLSLFEGYQLGVQGQVRSEYVPATLELDEQLRMIDLSKVEIISGSGRGGR